MVSMKIPAANRKILVLLAGVLWSSVGVILMAVSMKWSINTPDKIIYFILPGLIIGILVYRFGFLRLVTTNLERIFSQAPGKEKVCLFAFQDTRSYIIMMIMMLMGYTLRHLPVSKIFLVPVYLTIGLGLFLSSLHYYYYLKKPH